MHTSGLRHSPTLKGSFHARGRVTSRLAFALLLALPASMLGAQDSSRVWVNLRSGVYHCPGTTYYGKTSRGTFLAETVARERGYRANGNRLCGALPPVAEDSVTSGSRSRTRAATTASEVIPDLGPVAPATGLVACAIIHIADGDSIECAGLGMVRLIGVDAPESDQEPYGTAASAALAALAPLGSTLDLEYGTEQRDRYGRLLAYAWTRDGAMLNWTLARQGWTVTLPWPPNTRYARELAAAEQRARREGRGLWSVGGLRCRPSEHRQQRCDD